MNAPCDETLRLTATGAKDRNGKKICLGHTVRRYNAGEFIEGNVVYENCAVRILITREYNGEAVNSIKCLRYNYSLLFDEIEGTRNVEVIDSKLLSTI